MVSGWAPKTSRSVLLRMRPTPTVMRMGACSAESLIGASRIRSTAAPSKRPAGTTGRSER